MFKSLFKAIRKGVKILLEPFVYIALFIGLIVVVISLELSSEDN